MLGSMRLEHHHKYRNVWQLNSMNQKTVLVCLMFSWTAKEFSCRVVFSHFFHVIFSILLVSLSPFTCVFINLSLILGMVVKVRNSLCSQMAL